MPSNAMVYKSNALIEASFRLSVPEQRILLACIAQVRRDAPLTDDVWYSVTAQDIAQLSGNAVEATYSELKEAAIKLRRREVSIPEEPNGGGKLPDVLVTGWVQSIIPRKGLGRVDLRFNKDMIPYLSELTKQFTKYALADVAKMSSAHAIRLYEVLMQWASVGRCEVEIARLRDWLQLEDRYSMLADFKRYVIDSSLEQINKHSPLAVTYTQRKTGRFVTHLIFTFKHKPTKAVKANPVSKALPAKEERLYGYPVSLLEKHRQYADEPLEDVVPRMVKVAAEA